MKISEKQYKQAKPRNTNNDVVGKKIVEAVDKLIDAINKDKGGLTERLDAIVKSIDKKESTSGVLSYIEKRIKNNSEDSKNIIDSIGKKMDSVVDAINNRPSAFKFDVRRNNRGYIETVFVNTVND